jgi:hypothetical protein
MENKIVQTIYSEAFLLHLQNTLYTLNQGAGHWT